MCGYRQLGLATQLFLYCFDDVVRHERFPIVLSDIPVWHEAGFAAQVSGKLAAVVVLHNERVPSIFEDLQNFIAVERPEPAYLELIGGNALLSEDFAGLLDSAFGGAPADQRDVRILRAPTHM